ncbi:hypothetical protein AAEX28_15000 [Lentisphaerota bacterium WC36G]|nr:hypothetical protein LJT99_01755 [Lentisphaerae bacterium WC36]
MRNEYNIKSEFASEFINKQVGAIVEIKTGYLPYNVEILEIKNKYINAFHSKLKDGICDSFMAMRSFPTGNDGQPDVNNLIKLMKKQNENQIAQINVAMEHYTKIPSFYLFSIISRLDIKDSISHFATLDDIFVHTSLGTEAQYTHCFELLASKKEIIISPFVIRILLLLNEKIAIFEKLKQSNLKFQASELLISQLRKEHNSEPSKESLALIDGKPTLIDKRYANEIYHKSLNDCISFLETVTVKNSTITKPKNKSKNIFDIFDYDKSIQHSFHLSCNENTILWDDDLVMFNVFQSPENLSSKPKSRVFTQALIQYLANNNFISFNDLIEFQILLLTLNHSFCRFNHKTIHKVFNDDLYKRLEQRILIYLKESDLINNPDNFGIVSNALTLLMNDSYNFKAVTTIIDNIHRSQGKQISQHLLNSSLINIQDCFTKHIFRNFAKHFYS